MIDILEKIICGEISAEEAETLLELIIDKFHNDEIETTPQEELMLDKYEWTAIGFGIELQILANWRQKGWPSQCKTCGKKKNYKDFGWRIVQNEFVCIKCDMGLYSN